jgi:hypothetical protein
MIPREDLFHGYKARDHLLGKLEGIQLASRHMGTELSQAECYKLCGISYSEEVPSTPTKPANIEKITPDVTAKLEIGDGASPLSDCPSDISDWEEGKEVLSNRAIRSMVYVLICMLGREQHEKRDINKGKGGGQRRNSDEAHDTRHCPKGSKGKEETWHTVP